MLQTWKVVKVVCDETLDALECLEEAASRRDELLGNRPIGIYKMQPNYKEIGFAALGCLDLFPNGGKEIQ